MKELRDQSAVAAFGRGGRTPGWIHDGQHVGSSSADAHEVLRGCQSMLGTICPGGGECVCGGGGGGGVCEGAIWV